MNQQCVISTPLTKIEKIFNKASTMFPESKKILQGEEMCKLVFTGNLLSMT